MEPKQQHPTRLFSACAPSDIRWLKRWEAHLCPLEQAGILSVWSVRHLPSGTQRGRFLHDALSQADLIVLLLSPHFFADDECQTLMKHALARHQRETVPVIPLLLRPVAWRETELDPFTPLPSNERAVILWHNRDAAFDDCVRSLRPLFTMPLTHQSQQVFRQEQQREQMPITGWPSQDTLFRHTAQQLRRTLEELGVVPLVPSHQEHLNRASLLKQVRTRWIDGVLVNSLQREVLIQLGLHEHPNAVANPWSLIVQETKLPERHLPTGTSLPAVYDRTDGQVLILGEPGAGKTTLLLELAKELLTRAEADEKERMPVVFNLSSWATRRSPLQEWLVEELHGKYYVPRAIAQAWINQELVIPLLDGLDEVTAEHRAVCVHAINIYRRAHHLIPLVVCCRKAEYDALPTRVELHTAIMIEPLTREQMDAYCEQIGEPVITLRQALEQEKDFQELATTPLMLTIMTLVYQGVEVSDLQLRASDSQLQQRIFAQYVERALTRRSLSALYPKEQTIHWLSWLAQQLQRQNQTEFYMEDLQPDWLPSRWLRSAYRVTVALVIGLIVALITWFSAGLILWLFAGPVFGLVFGLVAGLAEGLLKGGIKGWRADIQPAEVVTWSWKKTRRELGVGLITGLVVGLVEGLVTGLLTGLVVGLVRGLIFGLGFGLLGGLIAGIVLIGPTNKMLNPREFIVPNYGLSLSIRNGLRFGLAVWLIGGLASGIIIGMVRGIVPGIVIGMLAGLGFGSVEGLFLGVGAVLQQALLLTFFCHLGFLPKNYVQFLDYATERILLRKVGGGYIFVHRLLRDYFANLECKNEGHR